MYKFKYDLQLREGGTCVLFHATEQDYVAMAGGHDGDAHQLMLTLVACLIRNDEKSVDLYQICLSKRLGIISFVER